MDDCTPPRPPDPAQLPSLYPADEVIQLRYRNTERRICTHSTAYLHGRHDRFRNWQLVGQAAWIAPPPCASLKMNKERT